MPGQHGHRGTPQSANHHPLRYTFIHSAVNYKCRISICPSAAVIGALQVYASDAYTLPGNTAVLPCLVMLPVEQAWAVEVTHWTTSSGPNNQHLVDSHSIPQRKFVLLVIHSALHWTWPKRIARPLCCSRLILVSRH